MTVYAQLTPSTDAEKRAELKKRKVLVGSSPKEQVTRRMAGKLALRGAQVRPTVVEAHELPYCDTPSRIGRRTDPRSGDRTLEVSLNAPCRRCAKCLQFRQMKWRERAFIETHATPLRSWLLTLTFSEIVLAQCIMDAAVSHNVEHHAYAHVQRYFKRLRKNGHRFRYLAVGEYGEQTGRLHYHVLLHEWDRPIVKLALENAWNSNVHARLVRSERGASGYVTKYLTKSLDIRPRASSRYGKGRDFSPGTA